MFIPSQGFRHAATLLITNSARAIPVDALPETTLAAVDCLAHELVALANDTRAPADASEWLIAELHSTIDRLPQSFDRNAAKRAGAAVLMRIASRTPEVEPRDLFLVYVPEDRLPVAAPVAIALTKRRVSIAFADYEVATAQQVNAAIDRGLSHHRGGIVLWTRAFERVYPDPSPLESERVRLLLSPAPDALASLAADLAEWARQLPVSKV